MGPEVESKSIHQGGLGECGCREGHGRTFTHSLCERLVNTWRTASRVSLIALYSGHGISLCVHVRKQCLVLILQVG
jgi:hypothetical protein